MLGMCGVVLYRGECRITLLIVNTMAAQAELQEMQEARKKKQEPSQHASIPNNTNNLGETPPVPSTGRPRKRLKSLSMLPSSHTLSRRLVALEPVLVETKVEHEGVKCTYRCMLVLMLDCRGRQACRLGIHHIASTRATQQGEQHT